MNNESRCPVCLNAEDSQCEAFKGDPNPLFKCDICGNYIVNYGIFITDGADLGLTKVQRAVLSHRIRKESGCAPKMESEPFTVTPKVLKSIRSDGKLPNPAMQAENLIRFVGDEVSRSGEAIPRLPNCMQAIIGALNRKATIRLVIELRNRGVLICSGRFASNGSGVPKTINLSLDGWKQYEAEKLASDGSGVPQTIPPKSAGRKQHGAEKRDRPKEATVSLLCSLMRKISKTLCETS